MQQCFNCHGRTPGAKAPGTCDVCHPKGFSLRPVSHAPASWETGHGKAALNKQQPCEMCHEKKFCADCHGLEMPHQADWAKGTPNKHSVAAAKDRQVCAKCHTEKPDLCGMCHHKGWEPTKGPWVKEHPDMVRKRGADFCMQCHEATYCFDCHVRSQGLKTPASG
jgi:RecJ-like exonuclease